MNPNCAREKVKGLNTDLEQSNPAVNASSSNNPCYTSTQWSYNDIYDIKCKEFSDFGFQRERVREREATLKRDTETEVPGLHSLSNDAST